MTSLFRPLRALAVAALLLVGAIALPAGASAATPEEVANCQATISALNSQLNATTTDPATGKTTFTYFTSLSVKDRTGLSGKLTEASQKLTAGKYADVLQKLQDLRAKVVQLRDAGKITAADATTLVAIDASIGCVKGLLAAPATAV